MDVQRRKNEKIPMETLNIIPVGGRGRGIKRIPRGSLVKPNIVCSDNYHKSDPSNLNGRLSDNTESCNNSNLKSKKSFLNVSASVLPSLVDSLISDLDKVKVKTKDNSLSPDRKTVDGFCNDGKSSKMLKDNVQMPCTPDSNLNSPNPNYGEVVLYATGTQNKQSSSRTCTVKNSIYPGVITNNVSLCCPNVALCTPKSVIHPPNTLICASQNILCSTNTVVVNPKHVVLGPRTILMPSSTFLSGPNEFIPAPNDVVWAPNFVICNPTEQILYPYPGGLNQTGMISHCSKQQTYPETTQRVWDYNSSVESCSVKCNSAN